MIEVLQFIFQSFWTFIGVLLLLWVAGYVLLTIAALAIALIATTVKGAK